MSNNNIINFPQEPLKNIVFELDSRFPTLTSVNAQIDAVKDDSIDLSTRVQILKQVLMLEQSLLNINKQKPLQINKIPVSESEYVLILERIGQLKDRIKNAYENKTMPEDDYVLYNTIFQEEEN